jgi:hypothetical protein
MYTVSQNARKTALSVSPLSLCYSITDIVPRLRRWFVGTGSGEARKGALKRKVARWDTLC